MAYATYVWVSAGHATLPNWSAASSSVDYGGGSISGAEFAPTEADVTLSTSGAWYWRPGQAIKSLSYLTQLYDASVGHNANLLLNFAPEYSGLLPSESVARFSEFGDWIRTCYGGKNRVNDTAAAPPPYPQTAVAQVPVGGSLVLSLLDSRGGGGGVVAKGLRVVVMEDQTLGQRIANFSLEGQWASSYPSSSSSSSSASSWQMLELGQSVGHKRILQLCTGATEHGNDDDGDGISRYNSRSCPEGGKLLAVRFTVHAVVGAIPSGALRSLAAYGAAACTVPPPPPHAPCELLQDYAFAGAPLSPPATVASVAACCVACRKVVAKGCVGFKFAPAASLLSTRVSHKSNHHNGTAAQGTTGSVAGAVQVGGDSGEAGVASESIGKSLHGALSGYFIHFQNPRSGLCMLQLVMLKWCYCVYNHIQMALLYK